VTILIIKMLKVKSVSIKWANFQRQNSAVESLSLLPQCLTCCIMWVVLCAFFVTRLHWVYGSHFYSDGIPAHQIQGNFLTWQIIW